MSLKTNPLKFLYVLAILFSSVEANALKPFECLRDLMTITDRANFGSKRSGVEEPFLINDKFLVFPEVTNGVVSGFYVYSSQSSAYYDAIEGSSSSSSIRHLGDLKFNAKVGVYELVAQPDGLETVTIPFLPGFQNNASGKSGPVVLGASVLPVIGAFVSRPAQPKTAYHNPMAANENDLKKWISDHSGGRRPASKDLGDMEVPKTIARLKTVEKKNRGELMAPLMRELKLRRQWIQSRNLDEDSFKKLSLFMEGNCKE